MTEQGRGNKNTEVKKKGKKEQKLTRAVSSSAIRLERTRG